MSLKVGDVVRLNSGSPKLTVVKVEPYGTPPITVKWIDKQNEVHNANLPEECLKLEKK